MTTLTVPTTTNFSAVALNNIDVIDFTNVILTSATATFLNTQFNGTAILNNVVFEGSAGNNSVVVNGGSVDASGWTFTGSLENITINGGSGGDIIRGSLIAETIIAGGGDDTVIGSLGADFLDGGSNSFSVGDTLSYQFSNAGVTVNLTTNTVSGAGGHAQGDTIQNFENVIGSTSADLITGDASNNVLRGGTGTDTLLGEGGQDTFEYTAGNEITAGEVIDGGTGTNSLFINGAGNFNFSTMSISNVSLLVFSAASSNITLDAADIGTGAIISVTGGAGSNSITVTGSAIDLSGTAFSIDWVDGVDLINLTGTAAADTITGSSRQDRITGGAGVDSLSGGGGIDTYFINAASELVAGESYNDIGSDNNRITMAGAGTFDFTSVTLSGIKTLDFSTTGSTIRINGSALANANITKVNTIIGSAATDHLIIEGAMTSGLPTLTGWNDAVDTVIINGLAGDVSLIGTNFKDTINGTADAQTLSGNGGDDILNGNGGNDTYFGSFGNDILNGASNVDTMNGGDGNDKLFGNGGNDVMSGGNDADTMEGGSGLDSMFGEEGDDTLTGDGGRDELFGNEGTDTFVYNDSGDIEAGEIINGGTGVVGEIDRILLDGVGSYDFTGAVITGIEKLEFGASATGLTVTSTQISANSGEFTPLVVQGSAAANAFVVGVEGGTANLRVVEFQNWNVAADTITINGSAGVDSIIGSNLGDVVNAGEGADTLVIAEGADILNGDGGNDTFLYNALNVVNAPNGLTLHGGGGTQDRLQVFGNGIVSDLRALQADGIEIIEMSNGAPTLQMEGIDLADVNQILAFGSSAILEVYGSADFSAKTTDFNSSNQLLFKGSETADTIVSLTNTTVQNQNLTIVMSGFGGNDVLTGGVLSETIDGGADNDTISGGLGLNTLIGGLGDDTFQNSVGVDFINGGGGLNDLVDYSSSNAGVTVSLAGGIDGVGGHASGDTYVDIENLTGSGLADILTGNAANNNFKGGAGNDTLIGAAGADVLDGGADSDTVSYANASGAVSVFLTGGFANEGGGVFDSLVGIENAIGSNFDDTFEGTAAANVLNGSGGIDTLFYLSSVAGVNVNLLLNTGTGGDAEGDTYSNMENVIGSDTGNDVLTGTNTANFLNGNGGADTLDGADGGDSLFGGDGDDILKPGAGFDFVQGQNNVDTVDYSSSAVGVGVHLFFGGGFAGDATGDGIVGVENVIGSAIGADTLFGNNADNILQGLGGDDIFHGSLGADVMDGGAGAADTVFYFLSAGPITVSLSGGAGVGGDAAGDTFIGIENLIGTQFGGDTLTGNNDSNFINGFGGADIINGGLGSDSLAGGVDNDTFRFTDVNFGFDFIGDWQDGFDTISIANTVALDMTTLFLTQVNASRWFVAIGTAGITVNSASAFTLDAGDFLFV